MKKVMSSPFIIPKNITKLSLTREFWDSPDKRGFFIPINIQLLNAGWFLSCIADAETRAELSEVLPGFVRG